MSLCDWSNVILLASLGVMIFASLRFKAASDKFVRHLLEFNEQLLSELCQRTQGDEQEHYRELRKIAQSMLEKS